MFDYSCHTVDLELLYDSCSSSVLRSGLRCYAELTEATEQNKISSCSYSPSMGGLLKLLQYVRREGPYELVVVTSDSNKLLLS